MSQHILWKHNDNLLILDGLKNYATDTYINNATVTATLYDPDDVEVAGVVDLSLGYVASSNGKYIGTIPDTTICTCHRIYTIKVTANGGDGLLGFWEVPLLVEERTQT